jgi:hypothetical protein
MPIIIELPSESFGDATVVRRTFLELQNEVLAHGFAEQYRPRVKTWLNEGLQKIARKVNLWESELVASLDTVAGTREYEMGLGAVRILSVFDTDRDTQLNNVDISERDSWGDEQGDAVSYGFWNGKLVLYPEPRSVRNLQIRFRAAPGQLIDDDDYPAMPEFYVDVMISFALSRAFRAEDDIELAQFYWQEWERGLADLANDVEYADESSIRQVGGMLRPRGGPVFRRPL